MAEFKVYFQGKEDGKGEYNLTSKNIKGCTESCRNFTQNNKWQWKMQDVCGINPMGKKLKRYHDIMAALSTSEEPEVKDLLQAMAACPVKEVEADRVRVDRGPLGPRGSLSKSKAEEVRRAGKLLGVPDSLIEERIAQMGVETEEKARAKALAILKSLGVNAEEYLSAKAE